MSAGATGPSSEAQWLAPRVEQQGLSRYISTLRDRWWIVVLVVLVALGAAGAYLATAEKVYKAHADMLVTPVSASDDATLGLGLIRESNDPTRSLTTASRFVTTAAVARRVIADLRLKVDPAVLLRRVTAEPLAQSSIVTITTTAPDPREAADLANAFAAATVADRTAQLRARLEPTIGVLDARLRSAAPAERQDLAARVATLDALRGVPDPTISQSVRAEIPTSAASPRPKLTIAAALLIGLVLGVGVAFAIQAIDPRLRDEEQLRAIYRVPIVARIPREARARSSGPLPPARMSPASLEAYRTLRATLAASHSGEFRSRSALITGSSPSEGKSTTALNFAHSLVQAGNRVILIEADIHRPTLGRTLGIRPTYGIGSVLIRQVSLEDALVTTDAYGPDLRLLLVDRPGPETADRLSLPTARQLISEAESLADFVVIDSAPLTEVVDALPLAQEVGDILVVVRLGRSKVPKLVELGEILSQHGLRPSGVALVGVERSRAAGYYYYSTDTSQEAVGEPLEPGRAR